jgi:hypothetical protein
MIYKTLQRKIKIEQHEPHKKTVCELLCNRRVNSSCSTIGTCCVTVVKNQVVRQEWGKDLITTKEAYPWWFVTKIPSHGYWWQRYQVMVTGDKDTKSWLLVTKIPSHGYLWQRYQVMVTCDKDTKSWLQLQNFQSDDFNLTTRNSLSFFKFTCNIVLIYLKTMCSLTECKCLFLPIIYWDSKTALSDYCWPWKVGFFKKFNLVNEHFIQRLVWFDLIFGV